MGFIAYDDLEFVSQNPTVRSGLNWNSLVRTFTSSPSSNWPPVTWRWALKRHRILNFLFPPGAVCSSA
jgi:hypothetical protein